MPQSYPQDLPARDQKKSGGFLGKLLGKASGSSSSHQYPQQSYGGYPQQQYGGYPQQQPNYGGYPQQGYQQGYGGGYGGSGYQQRPQKSGGLGVGGAAALGVGGGLIGGMLLEDAIDDHDQSEYQQGYGNSLFPL